MFFETNKDYGYLHIYLDDGETVSSEAEVIEQMAYSIDITFGELLNEGYPEACGNSYAFYRFTVFMGGEEWIFRFSNVDLEELNRSNHVRLITECIRYWWMLGACTPHFGRCNVLEECGDYLFVYFNENDAARWIEGVNVKPLTGGGYLVGETFELEEDYCNTLDAVDMKTTLEIAHIMEDRYTQFVMGGGEIG